MTNSANPLRQFFRQPAIYLRLPSAGDFWPEGSLDMPKNGELPVYPMTAIDEITYRTPDALYNGQSVVSVVESCIPNIKDAWGMPAVDLNAALVAIRIASYGHEMEITTACPNCGTEAEYLLDLRTVLDKVRVGKYTEPLVLGDLEIVFRPMSYTEQNQSNLQQFEQQKSIQMIQLSDLAEEEKIAALNKSLERITALTIEALTHSIASIRTPQAFVTEPEYIHEFVVNADRRTFNAIKEQIIELKQVSELAPMDIRCEHCSHEYKQQLTMDQTSFFAAAS